MNACHRIALLGLICLFGFGSGCFAAEPPEISGRVYIKNIDGSCGQFFDANLDPGLLRTLSRYSWLGECKYGLPNGYGFIFSPADVGSEFSAGYMQFGIYKRMRGEILPSHGNSVSVGGSTIKVNLWNEAFTDLVQAEFPTGWDINAPYALLPNSNNGSPYDDYWFTLDENMLSGFNRVSVTLGLDARNCAMLDKKLPGCQSFDRGFDVYGVSLNLTEKGVLSNSFTLCPNPKSPSGCDALWRDIAGPYIEKIISHIRMTQDLMASEKEALAKSESAAEAALPADWKSYWKANALDRTPVEMAQKCRELSDFHPINLANALYIQQKYTSTPCNKAFTATYALTMVDKYIALDAEGKKQLAMTREVHAQERERLAAANAEAWAGFFRTADAMLNAHFQIQQQKAEIANAKLAAMQQQQQQQQQQSTPVYQSYSQPSSSSGYQQTYAPDKVKTTPIHKPELDAGSCVKLAQLANGDPLSSFGSQVFSNQCGQTVEVFWCKVGDECERGAGGSTTLGAGRSWPVTSGQYYFGACIGANSGALVRNAGGVHTGRYACTGP